MPDNSGSRVLRHLTQRHGSDCVIASAAIVANCTYRRAAELTAVWPGERPMYPREIRDLLRKLTRVRWLGPLPSLSGRIRSFCKPNRNYFVIIRRRRSFFTLSSKDALGHAVVVCDGRIYDPERPAPRLPTDYRRADWEVIAYYFPLNAHRLAETQDQNGREEPGNRLWDTVFNR